MIKFSLILADVYHEMQIWRLPQKSLLIDYYWRGLMGQASYPTLMT